MYPGDAPQNLQQGRPTRPNLQLPERQHKRFSWQTVAEEPPRQGNAPQNPQHGASRSIDSQWSYEETPVEFKNANPVQRLAREPNMATIAQSPITPIDTRPQSIFSNAPLPSTQPIYGPNEYPPEKSASAFQLPPVAQSPVNQLETEYPPDKPATPYNIQPPTQPHPAMYAPVVSSRTPVQMPPHPKRASQQMPPQQRASQDVHQQPQQSQQPSVPHQSIPFMPTPIQIPSYTRERTPTQTPRTPRSPSSPPTRTPISPPFSPDSFPVSPPHSPDSFHVSPPHSPGALPPKIPADFAFPSPTFIQPAHQRPISSHTDVPYSPTSAMSAAPPIFSPNAPTGPNGLNPDLHQPGQIKHPNMDLQAGGAEHDWKYGMCECGDLGTCVTGLFCPCVLYGRTAYRLRRRSEKKDPTELLGYEAVNGRCGVMAGACGLWCLFPLIHRIRIRHLYKLTGSLLGDIGKACCCCCCVAIQNEREVRDREENARRWAGPANTTEYAAPGQMVYAPPPRG